MKNKKIVFMAALTAASLSAAQAQSDPIFAAWNFTSAVSPNYNTAAATAGSGTANIIGIPSADGDVLSSPGLANPSFSEFTWRVRGSVNNGWAQSAPEYSQGLELDASTVGYQNINFSFDWYATTHGIRDLQFQYNLNTANSAGWVNFGGTSPAGTYISTPNDFYGGASAANTPEITVDLSSIAGANNDASFGVRLVSAYDSTGNLGNEYADSTLVSGNTVAAGTSGNWRFDNLAFGGVLAVPEPTSLSMAGFGLAGLASLLALRQRSRKA